MVLSAQHHPVAVSTPQGAVTLRRADLDVRVILLVLLQTRDLISHRKTPLHAYSRGDGEMTSAKLTAGRRSPRSGEPPPSSGRRSTVSPCIREDYARVKSAESARD